MDTEGTIVNYALNLDKVCRACLSEQEDDQMRSIFSEIDESENIEDVSFLYEILANVTSMKVLEDDRMPSTICTDCYNHAMIAYKFRIQCERANLILQSCLQQVKLDDPIAPENINNFTELQDTATDVQNIYLVSTLPTEFVNTSNIKSFDEDVDDSSAIGVEVCLDDLNEEIKQENISLNNSNLPSDDNTASNDDQFSYEENEIDNDSMLNKPPKETKPKINQQKNYFLSMKKTSENGDQVFECNVCQKQCQHWGSLQRHFRTHTDERPFVCEICGKGFKQWTSLNFHAKSHSAEQPYACKLCNKRYKQSASLTAHMRIHTGQRPYLCSVCGKGFRQAPDLGYHMRTHTKEKPYMCTVCGKRMAMQCHLVQHMRTHTGEKPFSCKICSKAFVSSTRLKRHEIIHTGLKPFKCEVCDKCFNRSSTLRVHSMIHSDTRPYTCPICDKGFIQAHCLKNHLNTHK